MDGHADGADPDPGEPAEPEPSPWIHGITGTNFTVLRTEIADVVDQIHIAGGGVLVEDSWMHGNLFYEEDPNNGNEGNRFVDGEEDGINRGA